MVLALIPGVALWGTAWVEAGRLAAHAFSHLFLDRLKGSPCPPCPSSTCPADKVDFGLIEKLVQRNEEFDSLLLLLACLVGFGLGAFTVSCFRCCCNGARGRAPARRGGGLVVY